MIDLYYWTTPNGHKITMFLEEAGLDYRLLPINIGKGEQFAADFLKIAPNNRIPAIVDHAPADGGAPLALFESGAILLYLADKIGRFIPADLRGRNEAIQWLFWQMGGLGPMAGQNHHFTQYAPEPVPYAIKRYVKETARLYAVLNKHGLLSVDRALRAAEPEARGFSRDQALVRIDLGPAGDEESLRAGEAGEPGAGGGRGGAEAAVRAGREDRALAQQAVQHLGRQQREEAAEGALELFHRQLVGQPAPTGAISMLMVTTPMKAGR
jgi:hypothetical protein